VGNCGLDDLRLQWNWNAGGVVMEGEQCCIGEGYEWHASDCCSVEHWGWAVIILIQLAGLGVTVIVGEEFWGGSNVCPLFCHAQSQTLMKFSCSNMMYAVVSKLGALVGTSLGGCSLLGGVCAVGIRVT